MAVVLVVVAVAVDVAVGVAVVVGAVPLPVPVPMETSPASPCRSVRDEGRGAPERVDIVWWWTRELWVLESDSRSIYSR